MLDTILPFLLFKRTGGTLTEKMKKLRGRDQKSHVEINFDIDRPTLTPESSFRSRASTTSTGCISFTSSGLLSPGKYATGLAFDGGGVRGAAEAHAAQILRADLARACGEDTQLRDHFDMLAGTSTGGLIALMLGRLQVPAESLIDAYKKLSRRLFKSRCKVFRSIFKGSKYSGDLAQTLFEEIVAEFDPDGRSASLQSGACDVFVTSVNIADVTGEPVLLRTYDCTQECTIAEAAQATTAAPVYFPPKTLSNGQVVIDGGVRFNNPTELLIQELRKRHGSNVKFRLLLSIGTGEKSPIVMERCRSALSLLSLPRTMGRMMTDSEAVHHRVAARFEETDIGTYLRINIPGIGDIALDDYRSIPAIIIATENYMNTPEMLEVRRQVVDILLTDSKYRKQ